MSDELPITDPPRWTVRTKYRPQTKKDRELKKPLEEIGHELLYDGRVHEKAKGEGGLERLRLLAITFNRAKVAPRTGRYECAADAPNPAKYIRDCAP